MPGTTRVTFDYSTNDLSSQRGKKGMESLEAMSSIKPNSNGSNQSDNKGKQSEFVNNLEDDKNMVDFLDDEANYLEVDMGQIDEEERPFMVVDKDTGRVYDIRNEKHVDRLTDVFTSFRDGTAIDKNKGEDLAQSNMTTGTGRKTMNQDAWGDWWKIKKKNNQEFLWAVESCDIEKMKKFLSPEKMQGMVADANF